MALQYSLDLPYGINIPQAYARISAVSMRRHVDKSVDVDVSLEVFSNVNNTDKPCISQCNFRFVTDTLVDGNMVDIYNFVKTQPEFANSIDV